MTQNAPLVKVLSETCEGSYREDSDRGSEQGGHHRSLRQDGQERFWECHDPLRIQDNPRNDEFGYRG